MSESKKSSLAEKLILFAVFLVFAGIVVAFAFNWNYVEDEDQSDTVSLQYHTSSKTETASSASEQISVGGKININTATVEELDTLPGIGPSKAQAIIEYRETEGTFMSPDELMNVSGIGEKTYAQLKDYIVVE